MKLDAGEKAMVQKAMAPLIGLPLSDMWRYAGCQKFEFGEQRPHLNRKGEETTWADWGFVVSCGWRIEGPEGFVLSSDHFGPNRERRDEHAADFYESLDDETYRVESIEVREDGGLRFSLSRGLVLLILSVDDEPRVVDETDPDDEFWPEADRWRLMPPDPNPRGHLVLENVRLDWSG